MTVRGEALCCIESAGELGELPSAAKRNTKCNTGLRLGSNQQPAYLGLSYIKWLQSAKSQSFCVALFVKL